MPIFGEAHLPRILSAYAAYYNQARTHLALKKDAPLHRAVQRSGAIVANPILAELHHQYVPDAAPLAAFFIGIMIYGF